MEVRKFVVTIVSRERNQFSVFGQREIDSDAVEKAICKYFENVSVEAKEESCGKISEQ